MGNVSINIPGGVLTSQSSNDKLHDLTMLYLKNQDISNISVSELAQKYADTRNNLNTKFEDFKNNQNFFI